MKRALLKDSVKEIKNTYKKFLSILVMAFLGVGFFAGLRASSPDMVDTIDQYYKEQEVYDIQILSTLGLTEQDIEEISKIENVEKVYGTYETDGKIEIDNTDIVAKVLTIEEINKPKLLQGKMPENEQECLVEELFLTQNNKKIGDTIQIEIENTTNDEGEEVEYLKNKELKIVGTARSPLYISKDRGTSTLGAGKVNYYIFIPKSNINATEIYTNIYIKVTDSNNYTTSTTKYEEYVETVKENIEQIKEQRENARKEQLVEKANEKLQEAENELNTQKQDAETQIRDAEQQLADGKKEIEDGEAEIEANEKKADTEFANAQKQIENAKKEIEENEQQLNQKEQETNTQFAQLETQKQELQANLEQINSGIAELQAQYNIILEKIQKGETLTQQEEQQKIYIETQLQELQKTQQQLIAGITQIEQGIEQGKQEIEQAKKQIEQGKAQLETQEQQLNKTKTNTYSQIEEAKKEIENAKREIEEGEQELEQNRQEFEQKIEDAEAELLDAKEKVNDIEQPEWYILDRNANSGYVSFIQDTQSVENISQVFPIVFFAVAALISLTSMTRMVEEQRMEIGTLKALGYNKFQIISKYILYASLASVIGGILGMCVGFATLPAIIWDMYSVMYEMKDKINLNFNWQYGGLGLILICICIIGSTIYSAIKELKSMPATLMRPKAPKKGNRVLLEKIPFIWKKLNFSQKVTIRNIFRYKKRVLMTIIGISGCTALILTGFGLKDSIKAILPNQFENVFNYSLQINLKDELEEQEKQEFITKLSENENIEKMIETYMTSAVAVKNEYEEDVQIVIPKDEFKDLINLKDIKTKQEVTLKENEICLTDKAAQLLGVKSGETIIIRDTDNNEYEVKISNIVENYVSHYIYMSKEMYEQLLQKQYKTNVILTKDVELTEEKEDEFVTHLMEQKEISSVSRISSTMKVLDDTLKSLDYIVVILIGAAGILAFVVLYNLTNVNISERTRELATIKVLGFYDNEVYNYIGRESILLTIIGIALGLILGYFLNFYIIGTCEINMLRFSKIVHPISYLYAILITVAFTIIVNISTYFVLKKIDMIESLKSVE